MVANLKLVATATSFSEQAAETLLNLPVKCLVPKKNVSADRTEYKSPSYKLLILVLTMHVLGLLLLLSAKPEMVMVDVPQAIMTVSLVSNRAPEPEVVPLQTIAPQPETKKQKLIVKQKIPAKVEPAKELAVEEQDRKRAGSHTACINRGAPYAGECSKSRRGCASDGGNAGRKN